jgi:hypothetical protein
MLLQQQKEKKNVAIDSMAKNVQAMYKRIRTNKEKE